MGGGGGEHQHQAPEPMTNLGPSTHPTQTSLPALLLLLLIRDCRGVHAACGGLSGTALGRPTASY